MTRRTYGKWVEGMDEIVRPFIEDQVVWDLGAGSLGHTFRLLDVGASHVVAVDKSGFHPSLYRGKAITVVEDYYVNVQPPEGGIKVALLAWPTNHHLQGLEQLLQAAETVIYLGSNVGGNACGDSHLWDYPHFREVLASVPHRKNSLIVYGRHLKMNERRPMLGEEVGATCGMLVKFETSERTAREVTETVETTKERTWLLPSSRS